MTNFFKGVEHNEKVFQFLQKKFQQISESKRKDLMKNKNVNALLKGTEKPAREAFIVIVDHFLGKHKALNYKTRVENMLETFRNMGCNTSFKLHFLHSRLAFYFKQTSSVICMVMGISPRYPHYVKRYKRTWSPAMLVYYCWQLKREKPAT